METKIHFTAIQQLHHGNRDAVMDLHQIVISQQNRMCRVSKIVSQQGTKMLGRLKIQLYLWNSSVQEIIKDGHVCSG